MAEELRRIEHLKCLQTAQADFARLKMREESDRPLSPRSQQVAEMFPYRDWGTLNKLLEHDKVRAEKKLNISRKRRRERGEGKHLVFATDRRFDEPSQLRGGARTPRNEGPSLM